MGSTAIIDSLNEVKKKLNQDSMVSQSAKKLEMTKDYRWMGLNTPLLYYLISHLSANRSFKPEVQDRKECIGWMPRIEKEGDATSHMTSCTKQTSGHQTGKQAQRIAKWKSETPFFRNIDYLCAGNDQFLLYSLTSTWGQQAGRADIGGNLNPFGLEGRVRRTEIDLRVEWIARTTKMGI
ncbi:hypothetical protein H5410_036623 [Solanum commersonii]|uniref:Uncharacterized protein n=1 Tax=Solanum commersonii TaxID=4109 RepID=A0A9J5Y661_SOLCO|nr:hypothetical protein H5410_036623 [Solanum commersonii]